jgi:putative acetyltransferase
MRGNIDIISEDPRQPYVLSLLAQADAYFHELYPAESNHLIGVADLGRQDAVFLTARRDGELLGSIAFRMIAPEHAEMKRMFVLPKARGLGLGKKLLRALEDVARDRKVGRISLETGVKQPAAIGLYRAAGYQDCPPFGDYKADPLSLFMTKRFEPNNAC